MLDFLLTTDYASGDRHRFTHYGNDNMKYKLNANNNTITMQAGMPSFELAIYNKWMNSKSTYIIEYEETIFYLLNFKRSH